MMTPRFARVVSRLPKNNVRNMAYGPHPYADLEGKVIVVGGAGNPPEELHGIGATTSMLLASYGAKVVSVSHQKINADTVTAAIKAEGGEAMGYVADATDYDQCTALLNDVVAEYGKVDILINAGIHDALPNGFKKMTREKWESCMNVNCNAHFNLIHNFLPHFQEQGHGNIQHFTTFGSFLALGMGVQRHGYFAGKAAAAVLTRRIGIENASKNIRANVVSIGYATGPLVNRAVANAGADIAKVDAARAANVPRQEQIYPIEIARTSAFLASDASSGINAAEVFADGGNHNCTYGP
jgi:NAD(P)-dependent dehydrogenase (short-subunit alcohol dehydrogenase family)